MTDQSSAPLLHGRYAVGRQLGQGAFGQTLLARDTVSDRDVAIKMLHPTRTESWKSYELFQREARVMQSLRHHGVPEVFDVFQAEWDSRQAACFVMEYIAGDSLADVIAARKHLDADAVAHLFQEMLGVLEYLHTLVPPILHRDIKPANVIIRPSGFPALVDFGAVRSVIAPAGENGSTIVGTYGYMPYEQLMGQATPSSDLYALAATFLHLLTGRTPPEFMSAEGRLTVPESIPAGARFRNALVRMLEPAPSARFQHAREIRRFLTEQDPAPPVTPVAMQHSAPPPIVPAAFGVTPRPLEGYVADRYNSVAPNALDYLDNGEKPHEGFDIVGILSIGFFSLITAGVLPMMLWSRASSRRKRLRKYFESGRYVRAEVVAVQDEEIEFKLKIARVRYEFAVDGVIHRDADEMFVTSANKLRPGDTIEVLYLPDRNHDSVIISVL